jgi:hypothetical protein
MNMYEGSFFDHSTDAQQWGEFAEGINRTTLPDPEVEIVLDDADDDELGQDTPLSEIGEGAVAIPDSYGDSPEDDADQSGSRQIPDPGDEGSAAEEEAASQLASAGSGGDTPTDPPEGGDTLSGFDDESGGDESESLAEIDIRIGPKHIIMVNMGHKVGIKQANRIAEQLTDDKDWLPAPGVQWGPERRYAVDSKNPTLFLKSTRPPQDSGGSLEEPERRTALHELENASTVERIVDAPLAQQLVRGFGYKDIEYVAPIAAAVYAGRDEDSGTETVAYEYQKGQLAQAAAFDLGEEALEKEMERLDIVADVLVDVFQAYGVHADTVAENLMINRGHLKLLDAENYEQFEPTPPTYEPGQVRRHENGEWHEGPGPQPVDPAKPADIYVSEGVSMAARAGAGVNPVFKATCGEGRVIVLTDAFTAQSAIINIPGGAVGATEGERAISEVIRQVPSLGSKAAIAHIIAKDDSSPEQVAWGDTLDIHLTSCGVTNIKSVETGQDMVVQLHAATGRVVVEDLENRSVYRYQPLPPQPKPAPSKRPRR